LIVCGGLAIHNYDAAEEQAGGVGQNGGAAGRDAVLSEKADDSGEQIVDLLGGSELGEVVTEEVGGEVREFAPVEFQLGVVEAEGEARVGYQEPATFAVGEEERTAVRVLRRGAGVIWGRDG
jgi:hypothetical protein